MLTTEDIKILLEVQQKAYRDATELLISDLTARMKQLERSSAELTHSLEFTQRELDSVKCDNKALKEEVLALQKEICKKPEVNEMLNKLSGRLDYQEDYSRRNNLRIDGVDESPNETWEETQSRIQRLLRDRLEMGTIQLERAHRVGSKFIKGPTRPRTVVARFTRFEDRQQALRNSSKLKNTNVYINEDLCESSVQARKAQIPALIKARKEGKIAFFNHTKLIIRDRTERTTQSHGSNTQPQSAQEGTQSADVTRGSSVPVGGTSVGSGSSVRPDASAGSTAPSTSSSAPDTLPAGDAAGAGAGAGDRGGRGNEGRSNSASQRNSRNKRKN